MNKDDFQFIHRFILWLKRIFHNPEPPIEVPQPSEEASVKVEPTVEKLREVSPAEEKLVEVPLEEKLLEVTPLPEEGLPEIPSEEEPVVADLLKEKQPEVSSATFEKETLTKVLPEPSREEVPKVGPLKELEECPKHPKTMEEIETEPQINYHTEEAKTEEQIIHKEENETPKSQKPYKKKSPTEERKEEPSTVKRKLPSHEQRKTIHFGDTQRRRRSLNGTHRKPASDENIEKGKANKAPEEKEFATTVESPYVEINLDNAEVYLILPKQQFKVNTVNETPQQTSYSIDLNGKQQEVLFRITTNRDRLMFVEEKRILLEEPLVKFQVAFPDEIQGGEYNYNHNDKGLYAFVAIGNNRGRMYYLYNKDGNINALPKREVWILLGEDFELQTKPDVIEEKWIWGGYQPFRIDLSELDALVIKNRISGEEKSLALQSAFRVEGEQLVEDDFKEECPLFTSKILNIVAPYENQSGWNVWILHKAVGAQMVPKNWTGVNPLTLRLPDDLPCEFGEFQVDICQQDTRIPDETLFFRLMPSVELNYPKELIIPDSKSGHVTSTISIQLDSNNGWEFKHKEDQEINVKLKQYNFYEIELPPERDTFRFFLAQATRPDSVVNFQITIPRLKWRYSKQKTWNGISQKIERKDMKSGEPFYLLIQTNDFDNRYNLLAVLETNGQQLQEGKFIRKGIEYSLELNQFFDTIKHNDGELTIQVEIRNVKDLQLLGSVETVFFEGEPRVQGEIPPLKPRETTTPEILIQALVKCPSKSSKVRKGKGFSKKEIIDVGINLKDVRRLKILYDKRRESSHPWNVESLKSLMGGDKYVN